MTHEDVGLTLVVGAESPSLLVTCASSEVRRALGPAGWSAMEVLALRSERQPDGAWVATLGVRELAGLLGVGRDAAACALVALRDHGLVSAAQHRAGKGRFDGTRHTILLPLDVERAPSPKTRPRASRATQPSELHPSLFDDVPRPQRAGRSRDRDDTLADHSHQVANDVPRKLHELAFDRMRTPRDEGGTSC